MDSSSCFNFMHCRVMMSYWFLNLNRCPAACDTSLNRIFHQRMTQTSFLFVITKVDGIQQCQCNVKTTFLKSQYFSGWEKGHCTLAYHLKGNFYVYNRCDAQWESFRVQSVWLECSRCGQTSVQCTQHDKSRLAWPDCLTRRYFTILDWGQPGNKETSRKYEKRRWGEQSPYFCSPMKPEMRKNHSRDCLYICIIVKSHIITSPCLYLQCLEAWVCFARQGWWLLTLTHLPPQSSVVVSGPSWEHCTLSVKTESRDGLSTLFAKL